MYEFEPGVAYRFTSCMDGLKSFVAVAAERHEDRRGVEFVVPLNLIQGVPMVMDGREVLKVNVDGRDYCASAAAPLDVSAAFDLLEQIKDATPGRGEFDLMVVGKFGGTRQDRKSLPVRAQRDRDVSVKAGIGCPVATSCITSIGLGIAPGGDDRAALHLFKYTRPITGWGCARMFAGRLLGKMRRDASIISISNAIWRGCRVAR